MLILGQPSSFLVQLLIGLVKDRNGVNAYRAATGW